MLRYVFIAESGKWVQMLQLEIAGQDKFHVQNSRNNYPLKFFLLHLCIRFICEFIFLK